MTELSQAAERIAGHNYTELFSQAPAPIAIYKGRELRYVFVNEAYAKIFNYREIMGKTVREAFPELEGQPYYGILEQVYDTGIPFTSTETPAQLDLHNNGVLTTRYYNLVYTPYTSPNGFIEGVMAFGHDVTDQVEARIKEKESDLRFRSIVQQSVDPILILKGEALVLDVANDALFRLWNVGKEALGKPLLEILPEMKDQVFYDLLLDVYHNGNTHNGHETKGYFKRANGETEVVYFDFIYQPYREAEGNISGVLVLATDVTEQVLAKQKLAQSEINFRNMILQAPVAMCILKGPHHVVEIANARMYELWGKPEAALLGKSIFEGLPEVKDQGFEKLLGDVYTTGQRFAASERPVTLPRNGKTEIAYINFLYEAARDGDGSIWGIIAVATEVTEQVVARRKVEYAEESARLAIESADLGTYEVNLETNETITSPRFNAIWGLGKATTDRTKFTSVIHPDDLPVRAQAHKQSLETGNLHYEARIGWESGLQRWVKVEGKVLFDRTGKAVRLLGVIQDITEQKLFAEELSKKVDERTRALKEANKQLERSNEELEQFAYIASHDLQEPLRKIQLFNAMVMEQPGLTEASKKYIGKASEASSRMTGLIRDLLEYSRLSQNNQLFQPTDLHTILKNVLDDYEVLITQSGAQVTAGVLPTIEAVPLQMNQLFFNLVGNALKFAKPDVTPAVTITARKLTEETKQDFPQLQAGQEYYEVTIEDKGIGFDQAYADKIFTIFQRLNERSLYVGYGIGLALCRKIVNNHNGVIYGKGSLGQGASFSFILPSIQQS